MLTITKANTNDSLDMDGVEVLLRIVEQVWKSTTLLTAYAFTMIGCNSLFGTCSSITTPIRSTLLTTSRST